tara:strand:- start:103 stop:342 length:240 start_codon:yes stop_codon:yes gene_type:complete
LRDFFFIDDFFFDGRPFFFPYVPLPDGIVLSFHCGFKCYKFKIERLIFKNDLFIIKKPQINEAFFDSQLNLINPVISSV